MQDPPPNDHDIRRETDLPDQDPGDRVSESPNLKTSDSADRGLPNSGPLESGPPDQILAAPVKAPVPANAASPFTASAVPEPLDAEPPVLEPQVSEPQDSASEQPLPVKGALTVARLWLIELGETVLPAIVIAVLINLFLAQATRVYGSSMEPNLHTDQRLVVEKVSYRLHTPHRGDVVVVRMPERGPDLLIKRIIALPGETIDIRNGTVYINQQPLDEPYLVRRSGSSYGPTTVPEGHVFVLGDNRGASNDSRVFGAVSIDRIVGRAWLSYWPIDLLGTVQ
jgi:signal peptidase I